MEHFEYDDDPPMGYLDQDPDTQELESKITKAKLYQAMANSPPFDPVTPEAQEVNAEYRAWAIERAKDLMGAGERHLTNDQKRVLDVLTSLSLEEAHIFVEMARRISAGQAPMPRRRPAAVPGVIPAPRRPGQPVSATPHRAPPPPGVQPVEMVSVPGRPATAAPRAKRRVRAPNAAPMPSRDEIRQIEERHANRNNLPQDGIVSSDGDGDPGQTGIVIS